MHLKNRQIAWLSGRVDGAEGDVGNCAGAAGDVHWQRNLRDLRATRTAP
jgi:hypothetical protein